MITVLSNEAIVATAPSIGTTEKREGTSENYQLFPTLNVVNKMREQGWLPTKASQSKCRDVDNRPYTKHMVAFSHAHAIEQAKTGLKHKPHQHIIETGVNIPQVIITNSHNGTTAYTVRAGLFRLVCSNGLIIESMMLGAQRVRHFGEENTITAVVESTEKIALRLPMLNESIKMMEATTLTTKQMESFVIEANAIRWGKDSVPDGLAVASVNKAQRSEDAGATLWRTLNRVQESLVKGGARFWDNTNQRRGKVRPIQAVDADIKFNTALWSLAETFLPKKMQQELVQMN